MHCRSAPISELEADSIIIVALGGWTEDRKYEIACAGRVRAGVMIERYATQ
jgi:hypothetical protein